MSGAHSRKQARSRAPAGCRPERRSVDTGVGSWYPAIQTADGVLAVVANPVNREDWAFSRAQRHAEYLQAQCVNNRDCRGGERDQRIGARIGAKRWFGTLAPRDLRIVRLLAVRAPSVRAVVTAVAGYLHAGTAAAEVPAVRTVHTVRTTDLAALLAERRQRVRDRCPQLLLLE